MIKKIYLTIFLVPFLLVSCFQDNKDEKIVLNITTTQWSAIVTDGFGNIELKISGSTNADRVTIETHGDGDITEYDLILDSNKNFDDNIIIQFTHAPDNSPQNYNTAVRAYLGQEVKEITLESGNLQYTI